MIAVFRSEKCDASYLIIRQYIYRASDWMRVRVSVCVVSCVLMVIVVLIYFGIRQMGFTSVTSDLYHLFAYIFINAVRFFVKSQIITFRCENYGMNVCASNKQWVCNELDGRDGGRGGESTWGERKRAEIMANTTFWMKWIGIHRESEHEKLSRKIRFAIFFFRQRISNETVHEYDMYINRFPFSSDTMRYDCKNITVVSMKWIGLQSNAKKVFIFKRSISIRFTSSNRDYFLSPLLSKWRYETKLKNISRKIYSLLF